jgi:hypothetical protein
VLNHYGGKCACCGEDTYEFLAIDHINGGGNEQRKVVGGGDGMVRWLIKNNYPEGFQVLCHNCNMAKGFYEECPHKRKENNLDTEKSKLHNIMRKLAGVAFRRGLPLSDIVTVLWNEFDRLYGYELSLLTPEQQEALVSAPIPVLPVAPEP